jgi:hypothetical protein
MLYWEFKQLVTSMGSMTLIEKPDLWEMNVKGREVTSCDVTYGFSIHSVGPWDSYFRVIIDGRFILRTEKDEYDLSAEDGPTTICPALDVLHQQIESVKAYKSGILEMSFSNGIQIEVPVDANYEAWNLDASGGLLFISMLGSGFAGGLRENSVWRKI